jgi:hypothetical protein
MLRRLPLLIVLLLILADSAAAQFAPITLLKSRPAARILTISPAWLGKTTWDLDVDGPLTITTPGTYTITALGSFMAKVELWGGGGGGSGGWDGGAAGAGGTAAFNGLSASGGNGGNRPPNHNAGGSGGSGGTGSGGDTNLTGGTGGSGGGNGVNNCFGGVGGTGAGSDGYGNGGHGGGGFASASSAGGGGGGGGGKAIKNAMAIPTTATTLTIPGGGDYGPDTTANYNYGGTAGSAGAARFM